MRQTEFANGEYYHVYNRGVDKREVFLDEKDYRRFILSMDLLNDVDNGRMLLWRDLQRKKNEDGIPKVRPLDIQRSDLRNPLVELVAYCLNPNHYHFIIKQFKDGGIAKFMQKLGTSYTMYFNARQSRSGVLFQGKFKSIHIDSNDYLLYLSAYVNANNFIHGLNEKSEDWAYSSYLDYVGQRTGKLCKKDIILGQFDNNFLEYAKYIKDNALYLKEKKEMERYILE